MEHGYQSRTGFQQSRNMASSKWLLWITSITVVISTVYGYAIEQEEHYDHYPEYKFEYSVHDPHTHDFKSQKESRHGDLVKGYYQLKEADGSLREVHYTADKHSGFNAKVTRNGHPLYEEGGQQQSGGYGGLGGSSSQNFNLEHYGGQGELSSQNFLEGHGASSSQNFNLEHYGGHGGSSSQSFLEGHGASSSQNFNLEHYGSHGGSSSQSFHGGHEASSSQNFNLH